MPSSNGTNTACASGKQRAVEQFTRIASIAEGWPAGGRTLTGGGRSARARAVGQTIKTHTLSLRVSLSNVHQHDLLHTRPTPRAHQAKEINWKMAKHNLNLIGMFRRCSQRWCSGGAATTLRQRSRHVECVRACARTQEL